MDRLLHSSQADPIPNDYTADQMRLPHDVVIEIVKAKHLVDYKLQLTFSNGVEQVIDFEPFLRKSHNPLIRAYLDPQKFASFYLEYGDLVWDDYGLCFPIADLYENQIEH